MRFDYTGRRERRVEPIDTDVANSPDSTTNGAVPTGFTGGWSTERFIGNARLNGRLVLCSKRSNVGMYANRHEVMELATNRGTGSLRSGDVSLTVWPRFPVHSCQVPRLGVAENAEDSARSPLVNGWRCHQNHGSASDLPIS